MSFVVLLQPLILSLTVRHLTSFYVIYGLFIWTALSKPDKSHKLTLMLASLLFLTLHQPATTSLHGSFRREQDGWIYAKLQGSSHDIGYEYGQLLAPEIDEANKWLRVMLQHNTNRDWNWYRDAAKKVLWNGVDKDCREELDGLAEGLRSKGFNYDTTDMVVQNGWMELSWYYVPKLDAQKQHAQIMSRAPLTCSAFVATGSMTKDGKIVMAHEAWIDYATGERYNVVLDVTPTKGYHYIMDTWPGFIDSGDDFAINSAGIMVTETTIGGFAGFKEEGIPEFVRARNSVQFSNSIDDYKRIMVTGNNGGYANTWLVGDTKANEIAELELGLKNVTFKRSRDGVFVGANFPQDSKLIAQECTMDLSKGSNPCNDRHQRWNALMAQNKGQIDAEMAKRFLADHHDEVKNLDGATASTLCGHFENEDRPGFTAFFLPDHFAAGSVQGKVTTADMASRMSFWARMGHPCGESFYADPYLAKYPEYAWQKPYLRDMPAHPWTAIESGN